MGLASEVTRKWRAKGCKRSDCATQYSTAVCTITQVTHPVDFQVDDAGLQARGPVAEHDILAEQAQHARRRGDGALVEGAQALGLADLRVLQRHEEREDVALQLHRYAQKPVEQLAHIAVGALLALPRAAHTMVPFSCCTLLCQPSRYVA